MSQELAIIDTTTLSPSVVFAPGGIDEIISKVEREARAAAAALDISTPKGRKEIASLAHKVARSKTALDEMGKDLVSAIKKQSGEIDAERRTLRDRLDALRDEIRKPLSDYEAAEAARIDAHEAALAAITEDAAYGTNETAADLSARLAYLSTYPTRDWQEFKARADKALAAEIERTKGLLAAAEKREAEAAELARLRAEAEARAAKEEAERAERERVEREARIAEDARIAAEAKAKWEAEEAERAAREAIEKAERERREADQRAAKAEADRIEAERRATEAAEKAERDRIEAEARAKQAAEDAARREREAIEKARRAEEEAAAKREADIEHRRKINGEAVAALVAAGLSEAAAKLAITAIAKREVPHVSIAY